MRARTPEDRKLIEIFDPIADALGLEIVRVRLMGSANGSRRLQVMAERKSDGDINVEQCARLSRAISAYLDEADPITGDYTLEVSSPGIDRPLTRLKDFEAWEGHEGRIELDRVAEGRKRFRGTLAGVEEDMIALNIEGEDETVLIPFAWVVDAKLTLTDTLMKQGAEARAERGEGGDDIDFGIEDFIGEDDEDQDPANDDDSAEDEH